MRSQRERIEPPTYVYVYDSVINSVRVFVGCGETELIKDGYPASIAVSVWIIGCSARWSPAAANVAAM